MTEHNAVRRAEQLGAKIELGINWDWAIGFTRANAEKFIAYLDKFEFDHRGIYDGKKNTCDIRFRPQATVD